MTYTTEVAANRLDHNERRCYADGEVNLTYLLYEKGYRYDMNNCLINEAIRGKKLNIPIFFDKIVCLHFSPCADYKKILINQKNKSFYIRLVADN